MSTPAPTERAEARDAAQHWLRVFCAAGHLALRALCAMLAQSLPCLKRKQLVIVFRWKSLFWLLTRLTLNTLNC